MKRILALLFSISLLFSSALAETADFWEIMSMEMYRTNFDLTVDLLGEQLPEMITGAGVNNLSMTCDGKINVSENYDKIQMAFNLAIKSDDGLMALMGPQEFKFWYDLDFSEQLNYTVIMQVPGEEKYQVVSFTEALPDGFRLDALKEYQSGYVIEKLRELGLEPTLNDGTWTLIMTDSQFKDYLSATMETVSDLLENDLGVDANVDLSMINDTLEKLKNVQLFQNITLSVTPSEDEKTLSMNMELNVDTNIYEIYSLFATPPQELTKENSDLKLKVDYSYNFRDINGDIVIDIPQVNQENAVFLELPTGNSETSMVFINNELAQFDNVPYIEGNVIYLPLRETLNKMGITDLQWDGVDKCVNIPDLHASIYIDTPWIFVNGEAAQLFANPQNLDGVTFVTADFFSLVGLNYINIVTR